MDYNMRDRTNRVIYNERAETSGSSDSDHDSAESDPDYTRPRGRRPQTDASQNSSGGFAFTRRRRRSQINRRRRRTREEPAPAPAPAPAPEPDEMRNKREKEEEARCGFFDVGKLRSRASDRSDDACMICADGGELICCDKCPSTFHHTCMGLENIPQEAWFCNYCACLHCGIADQKLDTCDQCEKKFHQDCLLSRNILVFQRTKSNTTFCGTTCAKIFNKLTNLVGVKNELDNAFSWTLLRHMSPDMVEKSDDKQKWLACNNKLDEAWTVMDKCFHPTIDRHTKVNVLQRVIYSGGSNLMRINFNRFYTAVLERDNKIITVATIRVQGANIAEMPFVATRAECRRQGMLRKLLSAIESILRQLKVEILVIPSATQMDVMWRTRYGFSQVGDDLKRQLRLHNTLMFPAAFRLYKSMAAEPAEPSGAGANQKDNLPSRKILPFDLNLEPPADSDDDLQHI